MAKTYSRTKSNWFQRLFAGGAPQFTNIIGNLSEGDWEGAKNAYLSKFEDRYDDSTDALLAALANDPAASDYWNSLDPKTQKALLDAGGYWSTDNTFQNLWGLTGKREVFDEEQFLADLAELQGIGTLPTRPNASAIMEAAKAAVDAENAEMYARYDAQEARLDDLLAQTTQTYENDMRDLRGEYGAARSGLLSRQHQQNAQLMDTLQSQMSKQTRNALEAGASAGLRIAGNVNTLLSVQNKQSQQSLETSNQLAQMLLNQKSAERGLRNDYNAYMQKDASDRAALDSNRNSVLTSTSGRVQNRYNTDYGHAQQAYDNDYADYTNAFADNPLAESYLNTKSKSKYTQ